MKDKSQDPSELDSRSSIWSHFDQVALIGFLSAVFIAIRIAWVSNGNSAIAKVLLENADPLKMLMSSIIPNIGLFAWIGFYFGQTRSRRNYKSNSVEFWIRHISLSILLLLGIGLINGRGVIVVAVILAFKLLIYLSHKFEFSKLKWFENLVSDRETVAYMAMYCIYFLLIIPNAIWLSTENIVLNNQTKLTAYILNSDTNYVTVLLTTSEDIQILRVEDIISRQVCASEPDFRPFFKFFRYGKGQSSIPEC